MHGGKVTVSSDIEIKHGVGSSSALRLGVCAAFFTIKNGPDHSRPGGLPLEAVNAAWQLQSEGQGVASGYDIATQYAGGLVEFSYEYHDNKWKPHWFKHDLNNLSHIAHVFVGGIGAPTAQTTQTTSAWLEGANRHEKLLENSESLVDAFNMAIQWPEPRHIKKLIQACSATRQLFVGSPHFPTEVAEQIQSIPGCDKSWSWKTTGAGGEDAILLIGKASEISAAAQKLWDIGWHRINVPFSASGAQIVSSDSAERSGTGPRKSRPTIETETGRE
jgi:mevalonate kinase